MELQFDWNRISFRNLSRDNRVICDHGRQPRMPYLDEDFVNYVLKLKPWFKLVQILIIKFYFLLNEHKVNIEYFCNKCVTVFTIHTLYLLNLTVFLNLKK